MFFLLSAGLNLVSNNGYHHGDLKEGLIQAALGILRKQGADALSLRVIASEAGVSHMAPYSHFKNKKELFQAVAAKGFDELADRMRVEGAQLEKAPDLILAYGVAYVEFAIDNPQLYRLMLGQVENSGKRTVIEKRELEKNELEINVQTKDITIDVSIAKAEVSSALEVSSKRGFELLRSAFAMLGSDQAIARARALGAWSTVHGMAALILEGHFSIPSTMTTKEFLSMAAFY